MKMKIITNVIGALGTVTKGLLKGLEKFEVGGRVETIQTTTLLRKARILRRILETCCHSNSSERPQVSADVKNSYGDNSNNKNNNMNIYIYIYIYIYMCVCVYVCVCSDIHACIYLYLIEKTIEHESDDCTNCDWCFCHSN